MSITSGLRLMLIMVYLASLAAILGCATTPVVTTTPVTTTTAVATTTIAPTLTPQSPQPLQIAVVSITGPLQPINPGGPIIEITLKNVGPEPISSLTASLELNRAFVFKFDVTPSKSLLPDKTVSAKLTLIGGGFSDTLSYPLTINGILQNGLVLVYTTQVVIKPQTENNLEISLAPIHEVKVYIMKSNPAQIGVYIKGGLRDGCTTFHDIEITREGNTVNMKVTTQHPVEVACPAIYTYFEKDVNLGSDFIFGTTYTLNVNVGYTTTFIYQ